MNIPGARPLSLVLLAGLLALLSACGQKGDLYLPPAASPEQTKQPPATDSVEKPVR